MPLKILSVLFIFILTSCSCSDDTLRREDLFNMINAGDSTSKAVIIEDLTTALVDCNYYQPACINAFVYEIKGMRVKFLQYETNEDAYEAAEKINGYIVRNWALDDVTNEPILESFVQKFLGARKAF